MSEVAERDTVIESLELIPFDAVINPEADKVDLAVTAPVISAVSAILALAKLATPPPDM